ncbi:hypothetical protein CBS101457_003580 [Exobasidium rhododendri]|nr:hypothetical protein CBS101457_003580 [Exobasidium rhododendri]
MAGRFGGRFGTNQEQEQRRIQKEPVVVWKKDWVMPNNAAPSSTVKILKWVRTGDVVTFDEEEGVGEDTIAMDVDSSAMIEALPTTSTTDTIDPTSAPPEATEPLTSAEGPTVDEVPISESVPTADASIPADTPVKIIKEDAIPPPSSLPPPSQASVADSLDPLSSNHGMDLAELADRETPSQ